MNKAIWRARISVLLSLALLASGSDAFAWGRFAGGHAPERGGWARRNPVVVHNTYVTRGRGGCFGCGAGVAAVAGLVGGAVLGAAIVGSAAQPTIVEAPPPVVVVQQPQGYPIGTELAALPPGCTNMNVNGATFYQCGPTWYQPYFGGNSVYYAVVPAP